MTLKSDAATSPESKISELVPVKKGPRRGKKNSLANVYINIDNAQPGQPDSTEGEVLTKIVAADDVNRDNQSSPEPISQSQNVLKPKSQAKQLLAKEKNNMRSTSNKENVQPIGAGGNDGVEVVLEERAVGSTANEGVEVTGESTNESKERVEQEETSNAQQTEGENAEEVVPIDAQNDSTNAKQEVQANLDLSTFQEDIALSTSTAPSTDDLHNKAKRQSNGRDLTSQQVRTSSMSTKTNNGQRRTSIKSTSRVGPKNLRETPRISSISSTVGNSRFKSRISNIIPDFQLPGEKLAAERRAQKEASIAADQQSQAGMNAATTAFKARPVPKSSHNTIPVRQTKTSLARMNPGDADTSKQAISVDEDPGRRISSVVARRTSSVNTSSSRRASEIIGRPSMSQASTVPISRRTSSINDRSGALLSPAGNRQMFHRVDKPAALIVQERQEREDQIKKARAEAVARSREMNRKWKEAQMTKSKKSNLSTVIVADIAEETPEVEGIGTTVLVGDAIVGE